MQIQAENPVKWLPKDNKVFFSADIDAWTDTFQASIKVNVVIQNWVVGAAVWPQMPRLDSPFPPAPLGGPPDVPRPAKRHSLSSVSWLRPVRHGVCYGQTMTSTEFQQQNTDQVQIRETISTNHAPPCPAFFAHAEWIIQKELISRNKVLCMHVLFSLDI